MSLPDEELDLVVDGLGLGTADTSLDEVEDAIEVLVDFLSELYEGLDTGLDALSLPLQQSSLNNNGIVELDGGAELLLKPMSLSEIYVAGLDPFQLVLLIRGQVVRVLHKGVAGVLDAFYIGFLFLDLLTQFSEAQLILFRLFLDGFIVHSLRHLRLTLPT